MVCEFEKYLIETDSIYDLIANCFGILCDNIENHQAFIGEYMSEGAILCNACSAVQQKQEKVGMGSIVTKKETIAGCDFKSINRVDCCGTLCEESTCVYFLEYDFSFSSDLKNTQLSCYRYGA